MKILVTEFINKNSLEDLNNNFEIKFDEKLWEKEEQLLEIINCLLYTSPSPRDRTRSRMPSSA